MSEETLFREIEEDLQRDRLEKLARTYGPLIVAGVLLILGAVGGYVAWTNWQQSAREEGTGRLAQAVMAGGSGGETAIAALEAYAASEDGDRAMLARLIAGGIEARSGDRAAAVEIFNTVAADATVPAVYRQLATLLAVTHDLDTGAPEELEARLSPLTEPGNPWRYSALELTAILAAKAGDRARAADLFQDLVQAEGTPQAMRTRAGELAAFYAENG